MADPQLIWHDSQLLLPLIGNHQAPHLIAAIETVGMTGRPLGMLLHAWDFAPRPLSVAGLHDCTPYYAAHVFETRMTDLAEHGFLHPESGGYILTEKGRTAASAIEQASFNALAELRPLPDSDLDRLVRCFGRLIAAARSNPATPDCPCLSDQAAPDRPYESSYLGWLVEYISDLYRYKCDCHTTAWRPTGVSGFAMEPFTFIWRDAVSTLDELVTRAGQERMGRGHTGDDYARFVAELVERGWLALDGDRFALTDEGRAIRDRIEEDTDAAFYSVWDTLAPDELEDLAALIASLKMSLETL
jgi:hypothetical protein